MTLWLRQIALGILLIVVGWAIIGSTLDLGRLDAAWLGIGILALVGGYKRLDQGYLESLLSRQKS